MLAVLVYVVAIVMATSGFPNSQCSRFSQWMPWQPSWMPPRDDLYCHKRCENYDNYLGNTIPISEKEDCCTCNSCYRWSSPTRGLHIEYISVTGRSLVFSDQPFDNASTYHIYHTWQAMTEIPSNLCYWESDSTVNNRYVNEMSDIEQYWNHTVNINFQGNSIRQVLNLNCLTRLDTLDLKKNKITYLTNTSINQLSYLRNLDLSGNNIKEMDPMIMHSPMLNILLANFSENDLQQVDVTNAFPLKPFCKIDYSHNQIIKLVNMLGFKLDLAIQYGPGLVSLANNAMEVFPDLKTLLNMDTLSQWGQFMSWSFDLRGIQLNCDCNLEPFIALGEHLRGAMWQDYYNVTCVTPQHLAGHTAFYVDPMELVCLLDQISDCPRGCTCIDQPTTKTVYVDCSYTNLNTLPDHLPTSDLSEFISLNVSHNHIVSLQNRSYLHRVTDLDLSFNAIREVSGDFASIVEKAILDLSFNPKLRKIPQTFQFRNVCTTKMEAGIIDCNCDNIWIETWMETKYSEHCQHQKQVFRCDIPEKGLVSGRKFNSSMIDCTPDLIIFNIIIAVILAMILILILAAVLVYKYWYELVIIWTRIRQTSLEQHLPIFKHDVLISLNEEDQKLRLWINKQLTPILKSNGYEVFIPYMDLEFGSERDSEMARTMGESRTFLLILSDSYLQQPEEDFQNGRSWSENEWKFGWSKFREDPHHNLVIINYDYVSTSDVTHKQIKAFLRVGHVVNFGNHNTTIFSDICKKIGAPRLVQGPANYNYGPQSSEHPAMIEGMPPETVTYNNYKTWFKNKLCSKNRQTRMFVHQAPAEFPESIPVVNSHELQDKLNDSPFDSDIEMLNLQIPPVFSKLKQKPEMPDPCCKASESRLHKKDKSNSQNVKKRSPYYQQGSHYLSKCAKVAPIKHTGRKNVLPHKNRMNIDPLFLKESKV